MADLTLKLGDFTFLESEIPEKISFGGEQKLAVHKLVGGARVIDAMGRDDAALEWSGFFLGQEALQRARYLDSLRVAGKPLTLTWSEFSYQVIIRSFHAPFERTYKIPYNIACEVVQDNTKPVTSLATPGVFGTLMDDLNTLNNYVNQIADNPLTQAVSQFSAAMSLVPGGQNISRSLQLKLLTPLQGAQQRCNNLIDAGNTKLAAGAAVTSAVGVLAQQANLQNMENLLSANAVMGRMNNNINAANDGTQTVTAAGGTLMDLAAKFYHDATQWTTLASANKLTDPHINGVQQLNKPAMPDNNGGVPLQ